MTDLIGQLSVEIIGAYHDHLGVTGFSELEITAMLPVQVDVIEITIESHHAFDDSTLTLAVVLSCTAGACIPFTAAILALFQDIPESSPISTDECRALAVGTDQAGTMVHRHRDSQVAFDRLDNSHHLAAIHHLTAAHYCSTAHQLTATRHRSTAHRPATHRHAPATHRGSAVHLRLTTTARASAVPHHISTALRVTTHDEDSMIRIALDVDTHHPASGSGSIEIHYHFNSMTFAHLSGHPSCRTATRHPPLVETTVTLHSVMAVGARLIARIHFLNMSFDPTAISILFVISWMETSITIFVTAIVVTAMFFTILIITTTICSISLLTTALRTSSSVSVICFATILPLMQLFQFLLDSIDLLMEPIQLFDEVLDLWIDSIITVPSVSILVRTEVMFLGECRLPRVDMDACWQHESANEQQEAAVDG